MELLLMPEHKLTLEQKLILKQLLSLQQTLRHPEDHKYPIIKGLEGIHNAHQVLKEHELSGILIGGLSEEIWNQQTKPEDLYTHKDVDIAVLDPVANSRLEKFEGGIDWWLPQSERLQIARDGSYEEVNKTWYINGNGVILAFGIQKNYPLIPGLYLPDSDWVLNMRLYESLAQIDFARVNVEMDETVFEKFKEKLREKIKTRLPQFLKKDFERYILSPQYEQDYSKTESLELEEFDISTLAAINKFYL